MKSKGKIILISSLVTISLVSVSLAAFVVSDETYGSDSAETSIDVVSSTPSFLSVTETRGILHDEETLLTRDNSYTADGKPDESVDDLVVSMYFDYSEYNITSVPALASYSTTLYFKFTFNSLGDSTTLTDLAYSDNIFSLTDGDGQTLKPRDQSYDGGLGGGESDDTTQHLDAVSVSDSDDTIIISYYFQTYDDDYMSYSLHDSGFIQQNEDDTWTFRCDFDLANTEFTLSDFENVSVEIGLGEAK